MPPRASTVDDLGLVEPDHRFGEGIVVGIAHTPDRGLDPGFAKPLRVPNREILRSPIAVVDQLITRRPGVERLLQRIEGEIATERAGHAPAHDAAREDIDDEGDVGKAAPGRHVRQIRGPEMVESRGHKRAVHRVRGVRGNIIGDRRFERPAAHGAVQPHVPHQSFDRAAIYGDPLADQLLPDFARTIDTKVRNYKSYLTEVGPTPHAYG